MCEYDPPPMPPLPPLTDEATVEILDFLHTVIDRFESRYASQIRRYYDDRSQHNLIEPEHHIPTDDPPF